MHRSLILAALLLCLLSVGAHAACPGNPMTCGNPMQAQTSGSVMYAAAYGVKADGTTSDDVALKAAVDACAAEGTKLILPPGKILLTGTATSQLRNCHLEGTGVMQGTQGDPASNGTTILITSTTVKPFTMQNSWAVTGVNFYWPNQTTGTQSYQPLFSPTAGDGTSTYGWYLDNVIIVNAYDGIVASGGSFRITNSWMYAVHDLFRVSNIGDAFTVLGVNLTPGPWFTLTNHAAVNVLEAVNQTNTVFHFISGGNNVVNFSVTKSGGFAWRYGIKVDAGVTVGLSAVDMGIDSVGTYLDTTSGGKWAGGNPITGTAVCRHATATGAPPTTGTKNAPCFNMGSQDVLQINGFHADAVGSFVESNGSSVSLINVTANIGAIQDGGDYYAVNMKGSTGGNSIAVQNSGFAGDKPGTVHSHGIRSNALVPRVLLQNNGFIYLNEAIDFIPGPTAIITGNWIDQTTGSQSIVASSLSGSYPVVFANNQVDKPPSAAATACGTGCNAQGAFSGLIQVGSGTVSSGILTLPWQSANARCYLWLNGGATAIVVSEASATQWNWATAGAVSVGGGQLFFACPGQ